MRQKARRLARAVPAWILVVLLILSMVPVAHADEGARTQVHEGEIELTGKYSGKFSLDSSDLYLFQLENMAPGDSWEGKINVKTSRTTLDAVSRIRLRRRSAGDWQLVSSLPNGILKL